MGTVGFPSIRRITVAKWPSRVLLVGFFVAIGLQFCLNASWPFYAMFLLTIGAIVFWCFRTKCPQCGGRLTTRTEPIGLINPTERVYLDCPVCKITWDPDVERPQG